MNKPHITYLFGAGASALNMPVQSQLIYHLGCIGKTARMSRSSFFYEKDENQYDCFKSYRSLSTESMVESLPLSRKLLELLDKHFTVLESFQSADIYAKMLFLQKKDKQLLELKWLIDYYFTFRHWHREWYVDNYMEGKLKGLDSLLVDDRYDSLLATLLNRNAQTSKIELPKNVSFLNWNYDLNLELSYGKFLKGFDFDNFANFEVCPQCIHLNGHAIHPANERSWNDLEERLDLELGKSIKYAFESNIQNSTAKELHEIIRKTTHLVVVGYTFPTFNREFDREIIRGRSLKQITIQDKDQYTGEQVRDTILSLRSHPSDKFANRVVSAEAITVMNHANQFVVPNELDDQGPRVTLLPNLA